MKVSIYGNRVELERFAADLRAMGTDHGDLVASEIEYLVEGAFLTYVDINLNNGKTTSSERAAARAEKEKP